MAGRRIIVVMAVLMVLWLSAPSMAAQSLEITELRISNLALKSVIISWVTDAPADGKVYYRSVDDPSYPNNPWNGPVNDVRGTDTYYTHYVELTGLDEGTTYEYYVESSGVSSNIYRFQTPSALGETPSPGKTAATGRVFDIHGDPAVGGIVLLDLGSYNARTIVPFSALVGYDDTTWQQRSDPAEWYVVLASIHQEMVVLGDISAGGAQVLNTELVDMADQTVTASVYIRGPKPEDGTITRTLQITFDGNVYDLGDVSLPVELAYLVGAVVDGKVVLRWEVASQVDNLGWHIYRKGPDDPDFVRVTRRMIPDEFPFKTVYRWVDESSLKPGVYLYVLESIDITGRRTRTDPIRVVVGEPRLSIRPAKTELLQNYPNPFNPETWIPFKLSEPGEVAIRIYRSDGTLVREIDLGLLEPGEYLSKDRAVRWDGRDRFGQALPSGVYFYEMKAGRFKAVRRMVILR